MSGRLIPPQQMKDLRARAQRGTKEASGRI